MRGVDAQFVVAGGEAGAAGAGSSVEGRGVEGLAVEGGGAQFGRLELDEGVRRRARGGEPDDGAGVEGVVAGGEVEVDRVAVDVEELGSGLRFVARQYGHGAMLPDGADLAQGRIGTRPMSGPVRVPPCAPPGRVGWGRGRPGGAGRGGGVFAGFGVVLDEGAEFADLVFEGEVASVGVEEVADLGAQGPGVDGFHDEVGDAEAEGGGAQFDVGAEAGEEDDGYVLGLFDAAHVAHHVEAADAGHAYVEEEETDLAAQYLFEGLVSAGGAAQPVAQRGEGALQGVQRVLVVVDDEDPGIRRHGPTSLPRGQTSLRPRTDAECSSADKECTAQHAPRGAPCHAPGGIRGGQFAGVRLR